MKLITLKKGNFEMKTSNINALPSLYADGWEKIAEEGKFEFIGADDYMFEPKAIELEVIENSPETIAPKNEIDNLFID